MSASARKPPARVRKPTPLPTLAELRQVPPRELMAHALNVATVTAEVGDALARRLAQRETRGVA